MNILFLSFRTDVRTSAGGKRTYYQADYLGNFFRVSILLPKTKSIRDKHIEIYNGYFESFSAIFKNRNQQGRKILVVGTLIDLNNLPFVIFARYCGYKIILDKVENYSFIEDKQSYRNKFKIQAGLLIDRYFLNYLSDGLMVISTKLLLYYNDYYKPKVLLPNAIPISEINFQLSRPTGDTINIVYTGTFGEKDGVDLLVKAFVKVSEQTSKKISLQLVGRGTKWNEEKIKDLIYEHSNIHWHGFVQEQELQEILHSGHILTMTRRDSAYAQYGFPYKITEYLTTGNLILATKVGDVERYLTHLVDAYLVTPDLEAITEGLRYCVENYSDLSKIKLTATADALRHFDIANIGPRLHAFIQEVTATDE